MKRPLFIIIGIVFVAILLAIWIYVLFFGGPKENGGLFTDLGFGDTTDPNVMIDGQNGEGDGPIVDVTGPDRLRQITTKNVVGYEQVQLSASSSPMIYFAEAGVGHVYSINLETGEEKRISATTIPTTNKADFTPNGQYIIARSGRGNQSEVLVGKISTSSDTLSTRVIDENIIDFVSTSDNTFLYAVQTSNSVIAKEYFPISDTSNTLFTVPFREATIQWGHHGNSAHYIYPKTTTQLESFAFKARNGSLQRIIADGYGFSIKGNDQYAIYSKQVDNAYDSFVYDGETGEISSFSVDTIPEKCTFFNTTNAGAICAQSFAEYDHTVPDSWYKGITTYADNLWEADVVTGGAILLLNTMNESGRELDIINLELNATDETLYFQNKSDHTLWLFERIQYQTES